MSCAQPSIVTSYLQVLILPEKCYTVLLTNLKGKKYKVKQKTILISYFKKLNNYNGRISRFKIFCVNISSNFI